MILEGFEIENFSCIKRLAVNGLPATGVIVLHGPNGAGKSSTIEALRACLMDNKSTSKALARGFPKNSTEKPRVTVTFRAAGATWKIMKQFGTKESTLHSRTAEGQWKLETADPSEAHERTCRLAGGADSTLGLAQLLWLKQGESRLPDAKKFDGDVQSRLRAILGVLQTPLDDRFLVSVKDKWSHWFASRSKPGEKPKLKKDCPLAKAIATLDKYRTELAAVNAEFQNFEKLAEHSGDLEVQARDLRRQFDAATRSREVLQKEYEESLKPIELHRLAVEGVALAEKDLVEAQGKRQRRVDTEHRLDDAQQSTDDARRTAETARSKLDAAEHELRLRRREIQDLREVAHDLQGQREVVSQRLNLLALRDQANAAKEKLQQAEAVDRELEILKQVSREHPAPNAAELQSFAENRRQADKARAELTAAAIALTVIPDDGAVTARLVVDGTPVPLLQAGLPNDSSIRRRAEIAIPGWGQIEVRRGADVRGLDQIEQELERLEQEFTHMLATFGISANLPAPLDRLRELAAEKKLRDPEIERKSNQVAKLAPNGLEPLRQESARLERLRTAAESAPLADLEFPATTLDLNRFADQLKAELDANQASINVVDSQINELERRIDGADSNSKKSGSAITSLRRTEAEAREIFTTLDATAGSIRMELERMLTSDQIEHDIHTAQEKLAEARRRLDLAKLSESEETVGERLDAAKDKVTALDSRLKQVDREYNQVSGQLRMTAGLHQKRAGAQARVEELERLTERELRESEAYDRLYGLFEECREKQLGAVMGPIHERVMRWIRLLRIPGYQSIRFNDQFLPDQLIARGGAAELGLDEESVGTQQQLALMVRLALGSTLSTPEEPATAMLDDPLTYSDVARLDRMRAVLRSAASGETEALPPAGPLQIFVFTCHPEWFAIDGATVIDLGNPEVLERLTF